MKKRNVCSFPGAGAGVGAAVGAGDDDGTSFCLLWIRWMSLDPTLTRSAIHLKLGNFLIGNFLIPLYMHAYILNLSRRIRVSLYHDDDDDDDDNFQTALLSFL